MYGYTEEKNSLILISLLKQHGIKKVIASPGTTNISFVASIQYDKFFEIYSSADERSAAYIACGLAVESGEPVILTCTGATASRNYVPALTEAFYRKIPILAVTSTYHNGRIGNNIPQTLDRSQQMRDLVKMSVDCRLIHDEKDEKYCIQKLNSAILELKKDGGGPVHINLETSGSNDFSRKALLPCNIVKRYTYTDTLPKIPNQGSIGIFVGAHLPWSTELCELVEKFCEFYNAVVLVDHTSGYKGKYHVMENLVGYQGKSNQDLYTFDLLLHIGEISGAYPKISPKKVWRINPDGIAKDTFGKLENIFQMEETFFFKEYVKIKKPIKNISFFNAWKNKYNDLYGKITEDIPFSNIWIAWKTAPKLPSNSTLHLGILNSLRSWNFFEIDPTIHGYANTGGFGIDGCLSTLIGASLANKSKLYFGIIGDLAFFYDMNSLGNHNIGNNIRLLLINNGIGTEFKNYNHRAAVFKDESDEFIAAKGHYGNKSKTLVKHYAEDLGFKYISAENKSDYLSNLNTFISSQGQNDKSIIFEVFTNSKDESNALQIINSLDKTVSKDVKEIFKNILSKNK